MRYDVAHKTIVLSPPEQLSAVHHLILSPSEVGGSSVHEYRQDSATPIETDPTPEADVLMAVMHLRKLGPTRYWKGGKEYSVAGVRSGDFRMYDLRHSHVAEVEAAFNTVHLFLPRSAFIMQGKGKFAGSANWKCESHLAYTDQTLSHLVQTLIPSLREPEARDQLFCDYILQAMILHVGRTYGQMDERSEESERPLSIWQEHCAKELLASRMTENISTEDVASFFGLSADQFGRMFKRSTGLPPYRWLSRQRIDKAKSLLLTSNDSLVEIALACGFANQSHFTRAFTSEVGLSPGQWRRRARS